ncbi:putative DNA replication licensing factor MCM7 [Paratrimastix pyriformis]|uniref:DNA helicase n=1 Tax=Paratrimastix pyriformis TaxID=342808 RepID=A0ABQ8UJ77_9EUKA|nr:putative DNA replication licensing factor MCM7 [Paratrimastix pyriformis]
MRTLIHFVRLTYSIESCRNFLIQFKSEDPDAPNYPETIQKIRNRAENALIVRLDDIARWEGVSEHPLDDPNTLVAHITRNTLRYAELFSRAVDEILVALPQTAEFHPDVIDVLNRHRLRAGVDEAREGPVPGDQAPGAPRRAVLGRAALATVITYTCEQCGCETFQEQTRGTKFTAFQQSGEVPVGHIPRQLPLHLRGDDLTGQLHPGDEVEVSGVFLPLPQTGFRAMRAGLLADTYLDVHHIRRAKERFQKSAVTPEQRDRIQQLVSLPTASVYARLAHAIAPEIYGHEDVKKALLLLMVGGPTRTLSDIIIRGDLNICLMGDPGVAKSQLLKQITRIAPRAIYTTGKGSSGVGLTAAVLRDKASGEMHLEGGALVMADRGVCCIDEFDKMEDSDKTAIHEVMEQQTVSLAKGGITTTLNARTSILAAANPVSGRYNRRKSPGRTSTSPPTTHRAPIDRHAPHLLAVSPPPCPPLPPALGRVQRRCSDKRLAQHILHVHRYGDAPDVTAADGEDNPETGPIDHELIRAYISTARMFEPHVPAALTEKIVEHYVAIRRDEETAEQPYTYTSPRSLLSILRLSQALARLRFDVSVIETDVDEALRLINVSKSMLYRATKADDRTERYAAVLERVVRAGHSEENFGRVLKQYEELGVLSVSESKTIIRWL